MPLGRLAAGTCRVRTTVHAGVRRRVMPSAATIAALRASVPMAGPGDGARIVIRQHELPRFRASPKILYPQVSAIAKARKAPAGAPVTPLPK